MMYMNPGFGLFWMLLCGIILAIVVAGLAISVTWTGRDPGARRPVSDDHGDARRRLERQYAAGEIDSDEYYERLFALDPR